MAFPPGAIGSTSANDLVRLWIEDVGLAERVVIIESAIAVFVIKARYKNAHFVRVQHRPAADPPWMKLSVLCPVL